MKIDLRNVPDAEVSGIDLANVDITVPAPETEPQRQYYFMALLKQQLVPERAKQNGKEYLTACITTFGCQMNARDSEKLEGILETVGYHIVETEDADFVVYNTCTVRENANLRVYGRLGQLGKYKKKNPGMIISLCGCMMQEPLVVEKLKKSYHFVNLIFGTHNIYRFAEYLVRCMTENRMVIDIWKDTDKIVENLPVDRKYPFKSGVNIMFGCNNFCSYCIVPYVRGRERSRKPEEIIAEIKRLVADGVVEIMGIAREAGSRTKMAVRANVPHVDPVGACVGINGARVKNIVNELGNEQIDIVEWDANPAQLIVNALSPAKVVSAVADEEEKKARIIVSEQQLSLAIGKSGQNVRLAAKLTGYGIDIKSEADAEENTASDTDVVEENTTSDIDVVEE